MVASVSCLPMTECFRLKQYHNSRETAVQQPQVMWGIIGKTTLVWHWLRQILVSGWHLLWEEHREKQIVSYTLYYCVMILSAFALWLLEELEIYLAALALWFLEEQEIHTCILLFFFF